jgi:hypothetical protein
MVVKGGACGIQNGPPRDACEVVVFDSRSVKDDSADNHKRLNEVIRSFIESVTAA